MAQTSLLQGKRFYCREWVFHKIQHCLQEKTNNLVAGTSGTLGGSSGPPNTGGGPSSGTGKSGSWGVLLVGGPGSGKTALCTELIWPSAPQGAHRGLHQLCLAFHFCRAEDADTVCLSGFVRGLVAQIRGGGLVPQYEEKIRDPVVQSALQPGECERNPSEAFKRCVLLPLLSCKPPAQALFLLVDSVDEGVKAGDGESRSSSSSPRSIGELLAAHHELLPPWLLLICSGRRQNKNITKLFTDLKIQIPRTVWSVDMIRL
uniref:Nephrocystin 3-like N-terminal domain-containing protein n=1 Tax=Pygocentrus nattereri TaxID=42514 RepID=A0AAR2L526_PYGNA